MLLGTIRDTSASPAAIKITIIITFSIDAPTINRAVFSFLFMFFQILKYKRDK